MNLPSEKKNRNNLALGTGLGFAIGALFGAITGIFEHDIALWLSVGIGSGITIGAAIGGFFEFREGK